VSACLISGIINESDPVRTSLLISTYNWPEALELVLLSVLRQRQLPDEVVISDDGSDDRTRQLVGRYQAQFPVPLVHVWHEDKGFRKTIISNKAIRECTGDYIIQVDGDIVLHPLFVREHIRAGQAGYFVRGSRALMNEAATQTLIRLKKTRIGVFSAGVIHRLNALHCSLLMRLNLLWGDTRTIRGVIGCNMAYWKSDFIAVNGYNNDMQGWGREDSELAGRLLNKGIRKKPVKFHAVCYHLFHRLNDRDQDTANTQRMNEVVEKKIDYCRNGYREADAL
jgi:glycosyltransferase involved in cell wall biosynthesis